ncbi:PREDICTED: CKLF-like MARVEL transmembrane domain-containing protein 6 isoform X2 [Pseudopodoces humilis]|uniref:CKLF-like MARVEL transmembrane domain-containing protein 6 isoform X2 n=1 Tax=Pseudopodoces humilis TaxID=181119 RepID=UPI0006B86BEA|nr:PREDICTED: CKLF-like MARVEL transmembrane domain-containing protein 6 isoform X2 [Pseudopodoces humilis]
MENGTVYNQTTEPEAKAPRRCPCGCTLRHLWGWRLPAKVVQTIFSFVAVVCEEIVDDCSTCSGLYFFEFISCSAFLLSLLILCLYCTDLYESLGKDKVQKLVFGFFATFAFAAECGIELYLRQKQNIDGRPENPGNTPGKSRENQPLNKQR